MELNIKEYNKVLIIKGLIEICLTLIKEQYVTTKSILDYIKMKTYIENLTHLNVVK